MFAFPIRSSQPATRSWSVRSWHASATARHENPLGLPKRPGPPPQMPRRGGPIEKRPVPHVKKTILVASGKGGVGKSTVAANLAFALGMLDNSSQARLRVGLLDLDIFGPSVPKLMGLDAAKEPHLTQAGAILPLTNHGVPCMSMGFLLPRPSPDAPSNVDTAVVWRGLMVQKAVQQLLFDVDWRDQNSGAGLDVLVVDMPPGTGDVPLTVGQLVKVDGAVIVSTPQDVALSDVRKGIAMFRKISVPVSGLLLNQSHFTCPSCSTPHYIFGPPTTFRRVADELGVKVLGELPVLGSVSESGDRGVPLVLGAKSEGEKEWQGVMQKAADVVWRGIS
ncbi:P-loop containing nucleoside triphosphate hydrolase protein [Phanerochaete sordida]|uniref:P-loop containing nucleoside triphosphate hydrolase protein n=1 Tax=Phanerochaete sordida TaxID=48140 RepID=A0A9P3LG34_9APHY|nr:P-loop containing nucleoside triphosphate hydrolase protein [Phanerochaete sordida]